MPRKLETLGEVFCGTGITSLVIPASVTKIEYPFMGGLKSAIFEEKSGWKALEMMSRDEIVLTEADLSDPANAAIYLNCLPSAIYTLTRG